MKWTTQTTCCWYRGNYQLLPLQYLHCLGHVLVAPSVTSAMLRATLLSLLLCLHVTAPVDLCLSLYLCFTSLYLHGTSTVPSNRAVGYKMHSYVVNKVLSPTGHYFHHKCILRHPVNGVLFLLLLTNLIRRPKLTIHTVDPPSKYAMICAAKTLLYKLLVSNLKHFSTIKYPLLAFTFPSPFTYSYTYISFWLHILEPLL